MVRAATLDGVGHQLGALGKGVSASKELAGRGLSAPIGPSRHTRPDRQGLGSGPGSTSRLAGPRMVRNGAKSVPKWDENRRTRCYYASGQSSSCCVLRSSV